MQTRLLQANLSLMRAMQPRFALPSMYALKVWIQYIQPGSSKACSPSWYKAAFKNASELTVPSLPPSLKGRPCCNLATDMLGVMYRIRVRYFDMASRFPNAAWSFVPFAQFIQGT
jgi:hypothetical protein